MHLSSLSCVSHAPLILFFLILSPEPYLLRSIDYKAKQALKKSVLEFWTEMKFIFWNQKVWDCLENGSRFSDRSPPINTEVKNP